MKLTIEIDMDGDAFDDEKLNLELHRIFEQVRLKLIHDLTKPGNICDSNGNTCGSFAITEKE